VDKRPAAATDESLAAAAIIDAIAIGGLDVLSKVDLECGDANAVRAMRGSWSRREGVRRRIVGVFDASTSPLEE